MNTLKKIVLVCCFLFLCCGCTLKTDLLITSDKKVKEVNQFTLPNQIIGKGVSQYFSLVQEDYKDFFHDQNYQFHYTIRNNVSNAILQREYASLKDFTLGDSYRTLYESASIVENPKTHTYTFQASGENYISLLFQERASSTHLFQAQTIEINVQFHNVVLSSNADRVNSKTNTYTWIFDGDNHSKYIQFQLSSKKRYDLILPYFLNLYWPIMVGCGIVLLFIVVIAFYIIRKIRKKNQF